MTWKEAMKQMNEGKKVFSEIYNESRKTKWIEKGCDVGFKFYISLHNDGCREEIGVFNKCEDYDDWEVYREEEKEEYVPKCCGNCKHFQEGNIRIEHIEDSYLLCYCEKINDYKMRRDLCFEWESI